MNEYKFSFEDMLYTAPDLLLFFKKIVIFNRMPHLYKLQITSYAEGENVTVDVKTVTDGKVWLNPIPGDFLVTPHDTPQVMAYINDIPTKCSGDCSWDWSRSATPTILSVSPDTGGNFFIHRYHIKVFGRKLRYVLSLVLFLNQM